MEDASGTEGREEQAAARAEKGPRRAAVGNSTGEKGLTGTGSRARGKEQFLGVRERRGSKRGLGITCFWNVDTRIESGLQVPIRAGSHAPPEANV